MDNKGSAEGDVTGKSPVFDKSELAAPVGEVADFQNYLEQRSDLKPEIEAPLELAENEDASMPEKAPESMPSGMPAAEPPKPKAKPASNDEEGAEALRSLGSISIKRDAETLPKEYMQAVAKIINRDRKDPHKLLAEFDVARWDMMSKTFNRHRGDGLNGKAQ